MSVATLRDRAAQRILGAANDHLNALQGLSYRPANIIGDVVLPANTAEEIAMKAIECNASIRALAIAKRILDEEFKKIVDPHGEQPPEAETGDDKDTDERMY